MKKFLFILFGVFVIMGAFAAGENIPTSKSYVYSKLGEKQDIIPANDGATQVLTNTGTAGEYGTKGIYDANGAYATQAQNLVDAATMNAGVQNAIDSEFQCVSWVDDDPTKDCLLMDIRGATTAQQPYVSATGTSFQDITPTPNSPVEPTFYTQGNMILRRVGNYADSYDATTHKITRRIGIKILDGTEFVARYFFQAEVGIRDRVLGMTTPLLCSHFTNNEIIKFMTINIGWRMTTLEAYGIPASETGLKSWLAAQYNAGTPVVIYYQLATPTEENWNETTYNQYLPAGN